MGLNFSVRYTFGLLESDTMFCASDIGWVVGHSYILYAPLLAGASTVLYEGKPVGTPNAGAFWRILKEYEVNVMFAAPTALRAICNEDPDNKLFKTIADKGGLKQLRSLFLAGERSEPSIVERYRKLLHKYCAPQAEVIDVSLGNATICSVKSNLCGLELVVQRVRITHIWIISDPVRWQGLQHDTKRQASACQAWLCWKANAGL